MRDQAILAMRELARRLADEQAVAQEFRRQEDRARRTGDADGARALSTWAQGRADSARVLADSLDGLAAAYRDAFGDEPPVRMPRAETHEAVAA